MSSKVLGSVILGLLVGIAFGVVVYTIPQWIFDSSKPSTNLSSTELEPTHSKNHHIDQEQTGFDSIFVDEFSYSDLHELSEDLLLLDQHDLLNLVEKSLTQSLTSVDFKVQDMLVEMLAQNSPDEAVASVVKFADHRRRILLHSIFTNWSLTNFEQALSTASELPTSDRRFAIKAVLAVGTGLSNQELSFIASKFNIEKEFRMWEQELEFYDKLADEPSSAFDLLANDEVNDFQQIDLFKQVVLQWFQYDGIGIIFELDSADLSDDVFNQLVELVTEQDRETALELINGDDRPGIPWRLGYSLIDSWIDDDVEEAFYAVKKLPKSPFRWTMLQRVISEWGHRAPTVVLNRLREIPRLFRSSALSAAATLILAEDNPLATIDRISDFRSVPGTDVDRAIESVVRIWASDAPKLALEWVQNNTEEGSTYRAELLGEVLPKYALDEPEQAMTIAVQEFNPDSIYSSLESQVIQSLIAFDRLDSAVELLDQVRDEIRRRESVNVGAELVKQNRTDDALALMDSIPTAERSEYLYYLASHLTIYDLATDALEMIAKVPSAQLQSDVAERLLTDGTAEWDFTAEQIETLRSFVREQ